MALKSDFDKTPLVKYILKTKKTIWEEKKQQHIDEFGGKYTPVKLPPSKP